MTLVDKFVDAIKDLLNGDSGLGEIKATLADLSEQQNLMDLKLDHILLNQELVAAYLGLTPGGATAEDLDALGARIKAAKEQIANFDKTTTQQ